MDFSISADLASLKRNLRHLVETELKPHDAAIEEQGEIPPKALDAIRAFGLYGSNTPKRRGDTIESHKIAQALPRWPS